MNSEEIALKIESLNDDIRKLKSEKRELEKLLIKQSESFKDKFRAWANSDLDNTIHGFIPDHKKFPLLRSRTDDDWVSRHETFHILERFEDEMYWMLEATDEELQEGLANEGTKKDIEFAEKLAMEVYEGKLKSFIFDW